MNWKEYFLGLAEYISCKSKDPNTKVGAVAVGQAKQVLETGYNGLPRGVVDLPARMERPAKYLWTAHAEEKLINAGVAKVVCGDGLTAMPEDQFKVAVQMFKEAGVELILEGRVL